MSDDESYTEEMARERFAAMTTKFCHCGRSLAFEVDRTGEHDGVTGREWAHFSATCASETGLEGAARTAVEVIGAAVFNKYMTMSGHDGFAIGGRGLAK